MQSLYSMGIEIVITVILVASFTSKTCSASSEQEKAAAFLAKFNNDTPYEDYRSTVASWNYATNLTSHNKVLSTNASLAYSAFYKKQRLEAAKFNLSQLDEDTARQISFITSSATPKDEAVLRRATELESTMEQIYSTGKVIDSSGKELELDPDLYGILSSSRNYSELLFAWKGWRDAVGPTLRPLYEEFVNLKNTGAKDNGWKDIGEYWRSWYEEENFEALVEGFWAKLKPLYQELHAYVRYKLGIAYPNKFSRDGPIPAHLFGNMWAQSWVNIYDLVEPFKGKPSLDVTKNMQAKNMTPLQMVELAESFFTSIGLEALPASFYNKSMIVKPENISVICHASAWDFSINHDVRIKQCTNVNHDDLVTTHHELGHIQYYLQYWDQPAEYRTGANPGFHEAVGDTLSLSVDTPQHLQKIRLLYAVSNDSESDINALMKMALRKIAFLPFGFLIDQWRWKVFSGDITPKNYNSEWWKLRTKYQGIKPPVERSENDFDPGAKYHIPANTPYIRYFMSFVLQFQFHKAACEAAGHKGPLHTCSIYQSKAAGNKIGEMLKMGKSRPWPEALEKLTGKKTLDVGALEEYFKPLREWLVKQRETLKYAGPGWEDGTSTTQAPTISTAPPVFPSIVAMTLGFFVLIMHMVGAPMPVPH